MHAKHVLLQRLVLIQSKPIWPQSNVFELAGQVLVLSTGLY